MVKEIINYQCEICNKTFDTRDKAVNCESRGAPAPRPDLVGVIFGNNTLGAKYEKVVFAVPSVYGSSDRLPVASECKHRLNGLLWVCRDNGCCDALGKDYSGWGGYLDYNRLIKVGIHCVNTDMPAFKRMVEFLFGVGIQPKVAMPDGSIIAWEKDE